MNSSVAPRLRRGRRWVQLLVALLVTAVGLPALTPTLSVKEYVHTAWKEADGGALPAINGITQAADGYLWLATAKGLFRFDGTKFVHWTPPARDSLPDEDFRQIESTGEGLWV